MGIGKDLRFLSFFITSNNTADMPAKTTLSIPVTLPFPVPHLKETSLPNQSQLGQIRHQVSEGPLASQTVG